MDSNLFFIAQIGAFGAGASAILQVVAAKELQPNGSAAGVPSPTWLGKACVCLLQSVLLQLMLQPCQGFRTFWRETSQHQKGQIMQGQQQRLTGLYAIQ